VVRCVVSRTPSSCPAVALPSGPDCLGEHCSRGLPIIATSGRRRANAGATPRPRRAGGRPTGRSALPPRRSHPIQIGSVATPQIERQGERQGVVCLCVCQQRGVVWLSRVAGDGEGGWPGQPHHIPSPLWHQLIVLVNYPTLLTRLRGFLEGGASCFNDALSIHYTG